MDDIELVITIILLLLIVFGCFRIFCLWWTTRSTVRISTSNTLDLREMKAKDATSELECFLEQKEQERKWCNGSMKLTIKIGKGNHSPHGHPVLKPVVKKYLENKGYAYTFDPQNTGRLFVQLGY